MANQRHLDILQRGTGTWNEWRKANPHIRPDLSKVDFHSWELHLRDLAAVNLVMTDLTDADLGGCNLTGADLSNTWFCLANLAHAKLHRATLRRADLSNASLYMTQLEEADLTDAQLQFSNLVRTNFTGATLTGAKLYAAARDDWIIKDIKCEYVYWDFNAAYRCPKDRDLEPGEFEQLYNTLPTIEYVFEKGMTPIGPLIMDRVVQNIRNIRPEFDVKIDSINARGLAPSIKFTVALEEHKAHALEQIKADYKERIRRLEADKDKLYRAFAQVLENSSLQTHLLAATVDKVPSKVVNVGRNGVVVFDSQNVSVEQCRQNARELKKAIEKVPAKSMHLGKTTKKFGKLTKKKALDIVGGAIEDFGKKQVTEVAKTILELGRDLGPLIAKTAAYAFFKNLMM